MMIPATRKLARATGHSHYFTGMPCKRGHVEKRYAENGRCLKCQAEIMAERRAEMEPEERKKAGRDYYLKNSESRRKSTAKWKKKNRIKATAHENARRARKRAAGGNYTEEDVVRILRQQRGKCAYCRTSIKKTFRIDHIVSLARGGSNEASNIQLLCPPCNQKKYALHPIDFAQRNGLLI
jgi:5-methylcytosine-specific restriction endonuclease McrA